MFRNPIEIWSIKPLRTIHNAYLKEEEKIVNHVSI